jgi:hypothetical protein
MEKKTTRLTLSEVLDLPLWERDPYIKQMLRDGIARNEAKLKEQLEARGEDTSNFRSFLSLSPEEQSETAQRMLRERILYYEQRADEERTAHGADTASAGQ